MGFWRSSHNITYRNTIFLSINREIRSFIILCTSLISMKILKVVYTIQQYLLTF